MRKLQHTELYSFYAGGSIVTKDNAGVAALEFIMSRTGHCSYDGEFSAIYKELCCQLEEKETLINMKSIVIRNQKYP